LFGEAFLLLTDAGSEGRLVSFYLFEELGFFDSSAFEARLLSTAY
jgi:hypothetical protein